MRIGFIGVGLMGVGMAKNLLQAGHDLQVLAHHNRAPVERLLTLGATEADSAAQLAAAVEVIFLCLPNADSVQQVIGALEPGLASGLLIIDATTSLPETSRQIAAQMAARGIDFVDAPVTGGPPAAEQGTLTSMVGASAEAYARAHPLIEHYSGMVVRCGESGAGDTAKLIHNFVTMGQVALVVEAMRRCDLSGIDRQLMYQVMSNGGANSNTLRKMVPSALSGTYDGHRFSLGNAAKDVDYIVQLAGQMGEDSSMIEGIRGFFAREKARYPADIFVSELLRAADS
jgi:3-hydroxyisobutyrate dehydrogenase-like beta-hydroxyacid dehydrogenase